VKILLQFNVTVINVIMWWQSWVFSSSCSKETF